MIFVPVPDPGIQRANVNSVSPAAGSTVDTVAPAITVVIQNRDTSVNTNTIQLELNGQPVPATVVPTTSGADVTYTMTPLPASGANNHAVVTFKDNLGVDVSTAWDFVVTYRALDPALRVAGTGKDRDFNVRVVQEEQGVNTDNSLAWAESLLAPGTSLVKLFDTNVVAQVINYSQNAPDGTDGSFANDAVIPGITETGVNDDIAMEITAYLDLSAGIYRFGTRSDDGYKVQVAKDFDRSASPLAFHNGGPANETYDFVVSQGGLYPFRMLWYERGGGAHVEWFFADFAATPTRTLINDPAVSSAVKAYRTITVPSVTLQSSATLASGSFTAESGAVVDTNAKTVTAPRSGDQRFYRLSAATAPALHIKGIQFQGQNVVLTYE
jgi:hypothetical protein